MDAAAPPPRRSRPRWILAVAAGTVVVALLIAGALVWTQDRARAEVSLEPAADVGASPFLDAGASATPAGLTEAVRATVVERSTALVLDEESGTRAAPGDAAGLYAHLPDTPACDAAALADALAADAALASDWAGVRGVEPAAIGDLLMDLVPVYLTVDTAVTNHRLEGGSALAFAAVLQAGTAVLVDAHGEPAVRCACGNPLLPADRASLGAAAFTGAGWEGFDRSGVHTVEPSSARQDTLRVIDAASAELTDLAVSGQVGSSEPIFVATAMDALPEFATAGSLHVSEDGAVWEKVLDTPPLMGVDAGGGLAVAVGAADDGARGVILTSTDGRQWSDPIDVADPLVDVAHGEGTWIAVGNSSPAEESGAGDGYTGAIYRSQDGADWERVATTDPNENPRVAASGEIGYQVMHSVGHGDGLWVATATECAYRDCELVEFTSPDGVDWTRHQLDSDLVLMDVHHDGSAWGFVGGERDPAGIEVSMADKDRPLGLAGTSPDGVSWQTGATAPERPVLTGLEAGPDGWYAVGAHIYGSEPAPSSGRVFHSADLETWSVLGTVVEGASGIAVLVDQGGPAASAAPSPSASASASASTSETPEGVEAHAFVVRTQGIAVDTGAGEPELFPFDGPAAPAADALTEALGEPVRATLEGDGICSELSTSLTWGGLTVIHPGTDASTPAWSARVEGTAGDAPGVPVTTVEGIAVGMELGEVESRAPSAQRWSTTYEGQAWDQFYVDANESGEQATLVLAVDGVVTTLFAPEWVMGDC